MKIIISFACVTLQHSVYLQCMFLIYYNTAYEFTVFILSFRAGTYRILGHPKCRAWPAAAADGLAQIKTGWRANAIPRRYYYYYYNHLSAPLSRYWRGKISHTYKVFCPARAREILTVQMPVRWMIIPNDYSCKYNTRIQTSVSW